MVLNEDIFSNIIEDRRGNRDAPISKDSTKERWVDTASIGNPAFIKDQFEKYGFTNEGREPDRISKDQSGIIKLSQASVRPWSERIGL